MSLKLEMMTGSEGPRDVLFAFPSATYVVYYDLPERFSFPWCASAPFPPSYVPARMAVFFNCVPFGTDIAVLLGCLFMYKNLIVAKIMAASHKFTISDGYKGRSASWLTRRDFRLHIWRLRS